MSPRAEIDGARGAAWPWAVLLPAAYAVHLVEEWFGGEGLLAWTARIKAEPLDEGIFFLLNGFTFPLVLATTLLAIVYPRLSWVPTAWGAVFLVNGVLHLLGSAATASYFPGVVTGSLLYLPLGWLALSTGYRQETPSTFGRAVALGVGYHALVLLVSLS